ncbi:MAG: lipoate--protein ligase family protein [Pirellulaceae bacterium]|nr:lipoate--protein ligase family protein [Pirellulaceae bacterium]
MSGFVRNSMVNARLIIDRGSGPMNMAVDEALLLSAPRTGPTLRFYQWEQPTLSLGYFQSADERWRHEASSGCTLVRRSTGGGAILHDLELTYSFVMPVSQQDKSAAQPLYYAFHETLVQALADLNIEATLVLRQPLQQIGQGEPFLCFQRQSVGDVLTAGSKICGSAQRRQKEALLQHGSVLLRRSSFAPELPGIADLAATSVSAEELAEIWLPRLERRLDFHFQACSLNVVEHSTAKRLAEDRFGADSWSLRR